MIDSPVVSVRIPPDLRAYAGGHDEITASGDTVAELLDSVCHESPGICSRLTTPDGHLHSKLELYLGGLSVSDMAMPIGLNEVLSIVSTK